MTNPNLATLKRELLHRVDSVGVSVQAFPWENATAYGYWLAQTYYFVRHTTSFLALTASRFGYKQRTRQYRQIRHLGGESGHDLLLVNDLQQLGKTFEDFPELAETSALWQSQYYFIEHEYAAAHFAYAYLLEGLAAKKIHLIHSRLTSAYPADACRFLHLHMTEDQDHFEDGLDNLNELSDEECRSFLQNLEQTAYFYVAMLKHIEEISS